MATWEELRERDTIEREMRNANAAYAVWVDTSFGTFSSPTQIEKLKSFAGKNLMKAYEQGRVAILMPSEYAKPQFKWTVRPEGGEDGEIAGYSAR